MWKSVTLLVVPAIHTRHCVAVEAGLGGRDAADAADPLPVRGVGDGAELRRARAGRHAARAPHSSAAHHRAVRRLARALHCAAAARQDTRY